MKINYSVILIFITLLLICFRVPQSDIIDYLVFSNIKYEISLSEFLIFFNKDFLFFTTLYIIPLSGFLLLFSSFIMLNQIGSADDMVSPRVLMLINLVIVNKKK